MTDTPKATEGFLLRTSKVHRPEVVEGYVDRQHLSARLQRNERPLTLIVAPPGYGKTTLGSHLAETTSENITWLSLAESENNTRRFLYTLAHAWKTLYPAVSELLLQFADAEDLPDPGLVADVVQDALGGDAPSSVLVLDDYHTIHETGTHDLVDAFLAQLLDHLHIVILSRSSPPLRLGRIRSQGKLTDIRGIDLAFTIDETRAFVKQRLGIELADDVLQRVQSVTEGWVAGLQLILLASEGRTDIDSFVRNISGSLWQIESYLIEEMLDGLDDFTRDALLHLAVLEQFCADLVTACLASDDNDDANPGETLMATIRGRGMFYVPMDSNRTWFRFHHLFQDLLHRRALQSLSEEAISNTRKLAATWMKENGEVELAIKNWIDAGETELAAELVNTHGTIALNESESAYTERLLALLPQHVIDSDYGLLVLQAWSAMWASRYTSIVASVQAFERLANEAGPAEKPSDIDTGRLTVIKHHLKFLTADFGDIIAGDVELPQRFESERGSAVVIRAVAHQLSGDNHRARIDLYNALEETNNEGSAHRLRIMTGLCYSHWYAGELTNLREVASNLLNESRARGNDFGFIYALWFKAAAEYLLDDLQSARETLRPIKHRSWWPHQHSFVNCVRIAAAVDLAIGEPANAELRIQRLIAQQIERNTMTWLPELLATRSTIALASGRDVDAFQWASDFEPGPVQMPHGFDSASMTAARILLLQGSEESVRKAGRIIDINEAYFAKVHSNRFLLELLILRAVYLMKAGDMDGAVAKMTGAVLLARPAENIRIFTIFGQDVVTLLARVQLSETHLQFIGRILRTLTSGGSGHSKVPTANGGVEPIALPCSLDSLSKRESEVLGLLAEHLTNKEIGQKLFISPATVKRHTHNIYGKLGVNDRKAAIAKASGFGLI